MRIGASRTLIAIVTLALVTATAQAQSGGGMGGTEGTGGGFGGRHHQPEKNKPAERPKPKADEKAYDAALKQLPDKQYDAWRGVR
jgi:hypothetical protein